MLLQWKTSTSSVSSLVALTTGTTVTTTASPCAQARRSASVTSTRLVAGVSGCGVAGVERIGRGSHVAMAGIAQAAAMAENMERAGIALLGDRRRRLVRVRVVEEDAAFVGHAVMADVVDLQIGPLEAVLRSGEFDRDRR